MISDYSSKGNHFVFMIFVALTLTTISTKAQTFSLPYYNDFESGAPGWVSDSAAWSVGTRWELGSPSYGVTNSSHSGQNCWDTNLDTAYRNNANISLTSPAFNVGSISTLKLNFWCNFKLENFWDGVRAEYCTDTVANVWVHMDTTMMIYQNNWENAWSGNSNGWLQTTAIFTNPSSTGNIWFRLIFTSDNSVVMEGVSIDDFSLEPLQLNPIEGTVYLDVNMNNSIDAGDTPIPNFMISASPAAPYPYRNTDLNGNYTFYGDSGVAVTLTPNVPIYSSVQPSSYTVTIPANGQSSSGNDFLVTYQPGITDPSVAISSMPVRPGLPHNKYIHFHNAGTAPVSGTIEFTFDPSFTFNYSNATFNTIGPNTFEFAYSNLLPSETRVITCSFIASSSLNAGDSTIATAIIYPLSGDTNSVNNRDTLINIVVNSMDPNDKHVYPNGDITEQAVNAGLNLAYTVNFQNTGTAPAINILIMDQLDPNLDLSTFEFVSSSHPVTSWNIDQNRWLSVSFVNINLPDSNASEPMSHGQIRYRVKPYSTLLPGQTVSNTAHIYFDNNPAVTTNTTLNTVVVPTLTVSPSEASSITIFPNPANEFVSFIVPEGYQTWNIVNITGQVIANGLISSGSKTHIINIKTLQTGIYFVNISGSDQPERKCKIIISR